LAQLYKINPTSNTNPYILTNMNIWYNTQWYDLSFFFGPKYGLFSSLTTTSNFWNGCFSLKLINIAYTGFIITIRRANDNNSMSFYSTITGTLTSGTNGSGTTIATFLSGTTGYVTHWYDQSGKGNHATQPTTASQPIIDIINNCIDFGYSTNANLTMNIPSGTVPVGVLDASYSFVVNYGNTLNTTAGGLIGAGIANINNRNNSLRLNNGIRSYSNYWWANDFTWSDTTTYTPVVVSVTYNGTSKVQKGYVDGVVKSTTSRTGGTTSVATQTIGVTSAAAAGSVIEYFKGQIFSVNIFSAELPQSDITIFNNSIPTGTGLLNTLSTSILSCNGCYSLKLVNSNYTGIIIKVRRGSDNTTMSFYSNTSVNLTSGTGTTIATFLSGTTGYIDTWYDQSGKGNHATQTDFGSQPFINITNNCIDFGYSTNQDLFLTMPSGTIPVGIVGSYSFVFEYGNVINTTTGGIIMGGNDAAGQANSIQHANGLNRYNNYWFSNDVTWGSTTSKIIPAIGAVTFNGTSRTTNGYVNNVKETFLSRPAGGTTAVGTQYIGKANGGFFRGQMYSLNIFSAELPQSDIAIFNNNPSAGILNTISTSVSSCNGCYSLKMLNIYYTGAIIKVRRANDNTTMSFYSNTSVNLTSGTNGSGTTIATFLSGTTGYIDTLYDQSGKGNHATQTATGSQPIIDITNNCIDFGYSTNANLYLTIPSGTVPVGSLDLSYSFVVKHGSSLNTTNGGFIGAGTFTSNKSNSMLLNNGINNYSQYWYDNDIVWSNTVTTVPLFTVSTYNGTTKTRKVYAPDTLKLTSPSKTGSNTTAGTQYLGISTFSLNNYLKGQVYSIIIFSAELPQSDITILNSL